MVSGKYKDESYVGFRIFSFKIILDFPILKADKLIKIIVGAIQAEGIDLYC